MKKTIRLSESSLHKIISESVRGLLNEVDWSTYPSSVDFRDKDAWWKTQVDNDFPGHKVDQSNSWKETYSDLSLQKKKDDREAARQAKIDARNQRKTEREAEKQEKQAKRLKDRQLFLKTVDYVMTGEDNLMSFDQRYASASEDVPEGWYDGVERIPIVVRGIDKPIWFRPDSIAEASDSPSNPEYCLGWGGEANGLESLGVDPYIVIKWSVIIDPNRKQISFKVDETDCPILSRTTEKVATNYLNRVIRKKYAEVTAKMQKYGTFQESRLRNIVRESLRRVVNEARVDNAHDNLRAVDDEIKFQKMTPNKERPSFEDALAQLMVDNNLTMDDIAQYDAIYNYINPQFLEQEIENYKRFLAQDAEDDKRDEYRAWAEDQMADMGFDEESLA